jgi:hypothetical protein
MGFSKFFTISLWLLAAAVVSVGSARASTVLFNSATVVQGQQAFVQSFTVTTPGTLTITMSNIPWMDVVTDLNCFVTTTKGVAGSVMNGAGTESIGLQPGTIYAHWFGEAEGAYGAGVIGVEIQWQPGTPVALPTSLVLMLSGLGILLFWQRRRAPVPTAC